MARETFGPSCPTDLFISVYYFSDGGSAGNVLVLCNHRSTYIPVPEGEVAGRVSPGLRPPGCPAPGPGEGFRCRLRSPARRMGLQAFK